MEKKDLPAKRETDIVSSDEGIRPQVVIEEATKRAQALADVVKKKEKPVIIGGNQYLEFEDWQTLGQFYGVSVRTTEAEPTTINGIEGAKAKAILLNGEGTIVGGAEAYCLRDEDNWKDKPWFQLASMAQTRAGAKALRNRLAWVAVLAGYKPTPAEEMISGEKTKSPNVAPEQEDKRDPALISKKQINYIHVLLEQKGVSESDYKTMLGRDYGTESTTQLSKEQAKEVIDTLLKQPNAEEAE